MPKHRPTKKQKIEQAEKDQNQNNESLMIVDSNKNNENYFQSLFLYDWFLIELGRKLINNENENDLINILCLNRKINEKATIVFRQHFLNFALQKEIFKLVKSKEFKKVEQLFQTMPLSLNPNIQSSISLASNTNRCFHKPQVMNYLSDWAHSDCVSTDPIIHLSVLATRCVGLDSLVKSLLFHPRMNFIGMTKNRINELFLWAIFNGYSDVADFILKQSSQLFMAEKRIVKDRSNRNIQQTPPLSHKLDWPNILVSVIVFDRIEILKLLAPVCVLISSNTMFSPFMYEIDFFDICHRFQRGLEYFEQLLRLQVIESWLTQHVVWKALVQVCSRGYEFVELISKVWLDRSRHPYFQINHEDNLEEYIQPADLKKVIKILSSDGAVATSNQNEDSNDSLKLALSFAFSMGMETEFKSLIGEREWSDQDLLDLFKVRLFPMEDKNIRESILKFLFQTLPPDIKISRQDSEDLLSSLLFTKSDEGFKFVWNDKRCYSNNLNNNDNNNNNNNNNIEDSWIHDFVLKHLNQFSPDLFRFISVQCSLSKPTQLTINKETITTQFRNACLLKFLTLIGWTKWKSFQKPLSIEWNSEMIEFALKTIEDPEAINRISNWLLVTVSDDSVWTKTTMNMILIHACRMGNVALLESTLERFPKLDLKENDNEAFKQIFWKQHEYVTKTHVLPMINAFVKKNFRFKDSKERNEMRKFADQSGVKKGNQLKAILSIKLLNEK